MATNVGASTLERGDVGERILNSEGDMRMSENGVYDGMEGEGESELDVSGLSNEEAVERLREQSIKTDAPAPKEKVGVNEFYEPRDQYTQIFMPVSVCSS